jgi:F0F1-type ATP synthase beta subunit
MQWEENMKKLLYLINFEISKILKGAIVVIMLFRIREMFLAHFVYLTNCAIVTNNGHIVLSRKLADRGHFPAVDVLGSVSRLMSTVASKEHKIAAQKIKEIYATYIDAEDLINIGAFAAGSNRRIDGAIALIDRLKSFLVQGVRERTSFDDTVSRLISIAQVWDELLNVNVAGKK